MVHWTLTTSGIPPTHINKRFSRTMTMIKYLEEKLKLLNQVNKFRQLKQPMLSKRRNQLSRVKQMLVEN